MIDLNDERREVWVFVVVVVDVFYFYFYFFCRCFIIRGNSQIEDENESRG